MTAASVRPRVLVLTDEPAFERMMLELLATMVPSLDAKATTPADAPLMTAEYAIIDQTVRGLSGMVVALELRARGFRGGLVLIESGPRSELESRLLAIAPARSVGRGEIVGGVPAALASLAASPRAEGELAAVERDLRRAQQLMAMGEATGRIQHTLNNPLTALLAEAQLLEMEALGEEQLAGVRRIIDQARRVVAMIRGLEGTAKS